MHEFSEISVRVETRLFYFLSVNQLILSAQNKGYNQKEKVMYNRDWNKVERYIENRVLGLSVHLPPFE